MKSKAVSNKDRQAAFSKRMKATGFVRVTVWVHHNDLERVKKYVERLKKYG